LASAFVSLFFSGIFSTFFSTLGSYLGASFLILLGFYISCCFLIFFSTSSKALTGTSIFLADLVSSFFAVTGFLGDSFLTSLLIGVAFFLEGELYFGSLDSIIGSAAAAEAFA
jgi:hypothetical protein